jgi:hypothetical protein
MCSPFYSQIVFGAAPSVLIVRDYAMHTIIPVLAFSSHNYNLVSDLCRKICFLRSAIKYTVSVDNISRIRLVNVRIFVPQLDIAIYFCNFPLQRIIRIIDIVIKKAIFSHNFKKSLPFP